MEKGSLTALLVPGPSTTQDQTIFLFSLRSYGCLHGTASFRSLTKKAHQHGPLYARLLGFTDAARDWLRGNDSSLPLIQKWAPFVRHSTGLVKDYALADMLATDIQHACFTAEAMRLGDTDYRFTPHYLA